MDNKPKPKKPFRKIFFSDTPHDTELPENRYVERKGTDKVSSSSLKSTGAGISAKTATSQAAKVGDTSTHLSADKERSNVFSKFGDIVPYISNIANSFRSAPQPAVPGSIGPVQSRKVNFDDQRVEADRSMRGANAGADRALDENTAAAFKASSLASNIRAKNGIATEEANMNSQIGMQTDRLNLQVGAQNVGMMNQYQDNKTQAQVANQVNQSQNISNAADKYVAQQEFNDAQNLDREKWAAYQPVWAKSGVADRTYGSDSEYAAALRQRNPEQYKSLYGTYAAGGQMGDPVPGFKDLSGTASAVPSNQLQSSTYPGWYSGKSEAPTGWETFPTKDPTIGWNDWRKKAFPVKEDYMKVGTNVQYMINNNPNSNNYRGRYSHYSTAPVNLAKPGDAPTFARSGGYIGRKVY